MRFSLKWLLALMAYVALAAAAISGNRQYLDDLIWVLTILAFYYALLASVISRCRNPMAVGFVILWVTYLIGIYVAPQRVPTTRMLEAAGYVKNLDNGETIVAKPGGGYLGGGQPIVRTGGWHWRVGLGVPLACRQCDAGTRPARPAPA